MTPDRDPCTGCGELIAGADDRAPRCQRGAEYGQVGCTRKPPRGPGWQPPRRPAPPARRGDR